MGSAISSLWMPQKLWVGMVGLPEAGKTSIVSKLKRNTIPVEWKPTYAVDLADNGDVTVNGQPYNLFDYGGDIKFRPCWRSFLAKLDSILWVVDSTDREALPEAKDELWRLLTADILEYKAVLVFANKQDSPKAMSVDEIIDGLGLRDELKKSSRCVCPAIFHTLT
ncbi:ADP-ribosylation factor [Fusarium albosuccineum]|uniref:ADP-ribosylation factor n=1 Tax=Fusarium albosuccineum TaxID=1237068 RepID=A0A8H4NX26_9HYPO|nr:ADP-ribosylation factor [Fusarium albosuccineum]